VRQVLTVNVYDGNRFAVDVKGACARPNKWGRRNRLTTEEGPSVAQLEYIDHNELEAH